MPEANSVTIARPEALLRSDRSVGLALGAIGVLTFSFTFPATKLALRSFDPWFISFGRALVAGCLGAGLLSFGRARRPTVRECKGLVVVAAGVVVGFPTLTSIALQSTSASHGAVVIAILPAATAAAGVLRARESPSRGFWLAAAVGGALVTAYTISRSGGALRVADLLLVAAVAVCAFGYAEGAIVARSLGAPQTICWALVMSLPLTLPVTLAALPSMSPEPDALAGFLYVCVGSMLLGFFAWYGGLARAGVARTSQVQLFQTPLTLTWSALVLGERVGWATGAVAVAVLVSVAATQRARVGSSRGM